MNFYRKAYEEISGGFLKWLGRYDQKLGEAIGDILAAAAKAPKFWLGDGYLLNDNLKGISKDPKALRLPYPIIVLEYERQEARNRELVPDKRIVIAAQFDQETPIMAFVIGHFNKNHITGGPVWALSPMFAQIGEFTDTKNPTAGPEIGVRVQAFSKALLDKLSSADKSVVDAAYESVTFEATRVLELLEALSCSNVTHEPLPVRKLNKAAKKRGALPFDEYRVVTITNAHSEKTSAAQLQKDRRSPREHLRRGHIRVYKSGVKVWINSMVVNPGTCGKITKDYDMKMAKAR